MWIQQLRLSNFRLLQAIDLELDPGLNLFAGDNGAGKSSLLEAITALSRGRVAGGHPRERSGGAGSAWRIEAALRDQATVRSWTTRLSMQWNGGLDLMVDGQTATARELSRHIIVAAVDPRSHDLFEFGPAHRRRFLDWALFHVEPQYIVAWTRWRRLLSQRNQALARGEESRSIRAWNAPLANEAEVINVYRQGMAERLAAELEPIVEVLLETGAAATAYERGWKESEDYRVVLDEAVESDLKSGRTRFGPQRADLSLRLQGRLPDQLSRGQQKLLAVALMLAASRSLAAGIGQWPVLLLDDFEAELGAAAQSRLAAVLREYRGQCLVTRHEGKPLQGPSGNAPVFHVEHGQIRRAIQ